MSGRSAPPLLGVLETAVYSDDIERACAFYAGTLRLECILDSPRMLAFAVAPAQVLLVFRRGATAEDSETPGGVVPGHGSEGPSHFAFAVAAEDYETWKQHLRAEGVAIMSEVSWPKGGRSIYFDDPDGNVVELATPGLWKNY
jgi:catechol 2,3-dioxygenase-like lactoylglutathione lyase family enzyme